MSFWDEAPKPKAAPKLAALLSDEPPTEYVRDAYLYDGGHVCRVVAPRLNSERRRVQFHDRRSRNERSEDSRTAKEIIKAARR